LGIWERRRAGGAVDGGRIRVVEHCRHLVDFTKPVLRVNSGAHGYLREELESVHSSQSGSE
jgi:hypothetical protein